MSKYHQINERFTIWDEEQYKKPALVVTSVSFREVSLQRDGEEGAVVVDFDELEHVLTKLNLE